jgi:hypothetical protein
MGHDPVARVLTLSDLAGAEPGDYEAALCAEHVARTTAPLGWTVDDRRLVTPPGAAGPGPEARPGAPTRAARSGRRRSREQSLPAISAPVLGDDGRLRPTTPLLARAFRVGDVEDDEVPASWRVAGAADAS